MVISGNVTKYVVLHQYEQYIYGIWDHAFKMSLSWGAGGGGVGRWGVIDFGMRGGWSSFSIRRHKGKNKL